MYHLKAFLRISQQQGGDFMSLALRQSLADDMCLANNEIKNGASVDAPFLMPPSNQVVALSNPAS